MIFYSHIPNLSIIHLKLQIENYLLSIIITQIYNVLYKYCILLYNIKSIICNFKKTNTEKDKIRRNSLQSFDEK